MTELKNKHRYIRSDLMEEIFTHAVGSIKHVNKVVTGNGATTAFLNMIPNDGESHILTAPNLPVIFEKKASYNKGAYDRTLEDGTLFRPKMKFIHGSSEDEMLFGETDTIYVMIADSFVRDIDFIKSQKNITKIMVDEYHTVEIQSTFRSDLLKMIHFLDDLKSPYRSIITITATPNMFSQVDIIIKNKYIPPYQIHITSSHRDTVRRIKEHIDEGYKVVIGTNNASIISSIRNAFWHSRKDRRYKISARLAVGSTIMSKIVASSVLDDVDDPNIFFVSSAGFEGFDIIAKNKDDRFAMFMLEDRTIDAFTFYQSNIYQFFSRVRTRENVEYMEYSRLEAKARKLRASSLNRNIDTALSDTSVSNTTKLSSSYKYKSLIRDYCSIKSLSERESSSFTDIEIIKEPTLINLYREKVQFDLGFSTSFLELREITLTNLNEQSSRLNGVKLINLNKIDFYLKENSTTIVDKNLFDENYRLNTRVMNNISSYKNTIDQNLNDMLIYRACKNWNGTYSNPRLDASIEVLKDPTKIYKMRFGIEQAYSKSLKNKADKGNYTFDDIYLKKRLKREILQSIKDKTKIFREYSLLTMIKLLKAWSLDDLDFYTRAIGYRDYSLLTSYPLSVHKVITDELGIRLYEFDISEAFPRFLYSIVGKDLPDNFYGENKENKTLCNVLLNSLHIPSLTEQINTNRTKRTTIKTVEDIESLVINKLKMINIDDDVIDYLKDTYFYHNTPEAFFNDMSFYEKKLISKTLDEISYSTLGYDTILRRHDSFLLINPYQIGALEAVEEIASSIEFNNQSGLFSPYREI